MVGLQLRHKGILGAVLLTQLSVAPRPETQHHFVITPSTVAVTKLLDAAAKNPLPATSPNDILRGASPNRVRLEDLSGDMLSSMLRIAARMTNEKRSYTFHGVGHQSDLCGGERYGGLKADRLSDEAPAESATTIPFTIAAVLHVVGREKGDLAINNVMYRNLMRKCSISPARAFPEPEWRALVDSLLSVSGAATLEHPHPHKDHAEEEDQQQKRLLEEESKTPAATGNESTELVSELATTVVPPTFTEDMEQRRQFSAFIAALQSDVKAENDIGFLQSHPLHVSSEEAAANEENNFMLSSSSDPPAPLAKTFHFWPHKCDYRSAVAYESTHFVVLVNLKPITDGHLMVVPRRIMPTIHSLNNDELAEWGYVVKHCFLVLRRTYPDSQGISLAIQQGREAGQTVPHLHAHLIVYREEGELNGEPEPEESEQLRRRPRSKEDMQAESDKLRKVFVELEDYVSSEGAFFEAV